MQTAGLGDGGVSRMLAVQAWGPGFGSPTTHIKAEHSSTLLEPELGCRNKWIPGTHWLDNLNQRKISESTSREVNEVLKWRRLLSRMVNEEQGFVQQREGMPSWK